MKRLAPYFLLFPAILLPGTCLAATALPRGPHCPDGSPPLFTGHPFRPYFCPDKSEPARPTATDTVVLSSSSLPGFKDRGKSSFKDLEGRWQGLGYYEFSRFQIYCDIKKKGGGFVIDLTTEDYQLHSKNQFEINLNGSFWHRGRYGAAVRLKELPGSLMEGQAMLGSAAEPDPPKLDRQLVLVYKGRSDVHKLRFALEGPDKIRYAYAYFVAERGSIESSGELSRVKEAP